MIERLLQSYLLFLQKSPLKFKRSDKILSDFFGLKRQSVNKIQTFLSHNSYSYSVYTRKFGFKALHNDRLRMPVKAVVGQIVIAGAVTYYLYSYYFLNHQSHNFIVNVRKGLHDCVHKIPAVLPLVVPSTLFYEPNHEANVDRCKLAILPILIKYRSNSGSKHDLTVCGCLLRQQQDKLCLLER